MNKGQSITCANAKCFKLYSLDYSEIINKAKFDTNNHEINKL